ncbi:MAG: hypothetical protein WC375_06125 [Methanomassiliicoccales archaeon]|jgi:hypothetical protein
MMNATCTWGDGADVVLSLEGTKMVLLEDVADKKSWKYGTISQGNTDLTASGARKLASKLIMAAVQSESLQMECEDHDAQMKDTV